MSVTFSLPSQYKNTVNFQEDLGIEMALEYVAQYLGFGGYSFDYTLPPGGIVNNDETEYDAMVWLDARPKPAWATLTGSYFEQWKIMYRSQVVTYGVRQDLYVSMDKPAMDLKADVSALASKANSSHTHAESDVTNLSTDMGTMNTSIASMSSALAGKVDKITGKGLSTEDYSTAEKTKLSGIATGATANSSNSTLLDRANHTGSQAMSTITGLSAEFAKYVLGQGSNYLIKQMNGAAISDANGLVPVHLTDTGLSGGTALWKTSAGNTPKVFAVAVDGSGNPMQGVNVVEYSWTNSNKTVNFYCSRPKAAALLGGDVAQHAVGYTILVFALGEKA